MSSNCFRDISLKEFQMCYGRCYNADDNAPKESRRTSNSSSIDIGVALSI